MHQLKDKTLVAQMVKCLPTMQETWVQSGWEDPLEKEMATHSSILASKILRTEEPSRLQSMGSQRVGHDWATSLSLFPSETTKTYGLQGTGENPLEMKEKNRGKNSPLWRRGRKKFWTKTTSNPLPLGQNRTAHSVKRLRPRETTPA